VKWLLCIFIWAFSLGSHAYAAPSEADRAAYQELFALSFKNPRDLDAAFKFASFATRLGEYEAAIGALERMLFYSPNLVRVRLELGALYFKLGSYQQARAYFDAVIAEPNVPSEVIFKAQAFNDEIDHRMQTSIFSTSIQFGTRFQTNVNSGTSSSTVKALGFDATPGTAVTPRADTSMFLGAGARYLYDLQNQNGDALEANFNGYASQQVIVSAYNTLIGEANFGPRIMLSENFGPGAYVRPYLSGALMGLGNAYYAETSAVGTTLKMPLFTGSLEQGLEIRQRHFHNSVNFATASVQSGNLVSYTNFLKIPLSEILSSGTKLSLNSTQATNDIYSNKQISLDQILYLKSSLLHHSATYNGSVGLSYTSYDKADELIDSSTKREDLSTALSGGVAIDLSKNSGLIGQIRYLTNKSSLSNYTYTDLMFMLGPQIQF